MNKKVKAFLNFIIFDLIFFLGGSATFFAVPWGLKNYPMHLQWNVFLVLSADTSGHDSGTGKSIMLGFVIPAIILFAVCKLAYFLITKLSTSLRYAENNKSKTSIIISSGIEKSILRPSARFWNIVKFSYFVLSLIVLITATKAWRYLNISKIITGQPVESQFYKDNCVTSDSFTVTPPLKKRNIIYIFMESMESDFTDIQHGGVFEKNLIPNLTELAENNVSFSETENIGGGTNLQGTSWTVAGLLSKLNSLPYFDPFVSDQNGEHCLANVKGLNDVLFDQGYMQIFSMGSEKQFENRDTVLESHHIQIHDINWYKNNNLIPKDYQVFWGFEDLKLYQMAKIELKNLSSQNKPFFYGLLTVDTHFPKGFKCSECKNETNSQMDNVILCADRQVADFINWIQEQDWYKDTTIIITGDHNYLNAPLNNFINEESLLSRKEIDAKRKFLNIIINSAVEIKLEQMKNRRFSSFDVTPTLLEAAGNKINGQGMYLGRSLLSGNKTLCEQYPSDYIEKEIMQKTVEYEELK